MKTNGTAGVLIQSGDVRRIIEEALRLIDFEASSLTDPAGGGALPPAGLLRPAQCEDILAQCDLIFVDQSSADTLLSELVKTAAGNHRSLPPVVLICEDGRPADATADLDFDGILHLPITAEQLAGRLRDILHVHRAQAKNCHRLLGELSTVRKVLQSVTTGVSMADATQPDLPIVYVNPAFERMTGYSLEEMRGRNCRFLQGAATGQEALHGLRAAIREQRDSMSVLRNFRKDGTPFWNELYLSPLRNDEGRVTHFVGIQNDVTLRVESEQRLAFLAHHDALTGVANRALLFERLQQAVARASRNGTGVAVLFFDLNKFKQVNDVYGHDTGDSFLRVVAERLQREVRNCDTVARMGGDEFVVLIADMASDFAEGPGLPALIQRLVRGIAEPTEIGGHLFHPSASVGWSLCPRDGCDPEHLLQVADSLMYATRYEKRLEREREETVDSAVLSPDRV